jgi:solute carrier family 50 (sugar transporter)
MQNLFVFFANAPGFLLAIWLNLCAGKLQYHTYKTEQVRKSLLLFLEEERSKNCVQPFTKDAEQVESPASTFGDTAKIAIQLTTQETSAPAPHEQMVVTMVVIWTVVLSILGFASSMEARTKELIVGVIVNINGTIAFASFTSGNGIRLLLTLVPSSVMFFYGAPLSTMVTVLKTKSSSSIHAPTMAMNTLNAVFWTAYGIAVVDPFLFVPNGMGAFFGACQIVLMVLFPRKPVEDMEDPPGLLSSSQSDNLGSTDSCGVGTLGATVELDATQAES